MKRIKKAVENEVAFSAEARRFVRSVLGLKGDFQIARFRVSGGVDVLPQIDLRIIPDSPETAFCSFRDTGSARIDRFIYLLMVWLDANGGEFSGSPSSLFSRMTGRRSVLSSIERKAVPAPNWIGRALSQAAAVGSKTVSFRYRRTTGGKRVWEIRLKGGAK